MIYPEGEDISYLNRKQDRFGYTRAAWIGAVVVALFTFGFGFVLFPWVTSKRMNCRRCGAPDGGW